MSLLSTLALTHIYNYIHTVSPLVTISAPPPDPVGRRLVPRSSASLAVPLPVEFTVSGFGEVENHRMSRTGKGGKERFRSGPRDSGPDSGRCARSSSILQVCTTTLPSTTSNRREMRVESVLPCDREVTLTVLRRGTVSEFPASRRGTVDDDDGDRAERRLL